MCRMSANSTESTGYGSSSLVSEVQNQNLQTSGEEKTYKLALIKGRPLHLVYHFNKGNYSLFPSTCKIDLVSDLNGIHQPHVLHHLTGSHDKEDQSFLVGVFWNFLWLLSICPQIILFNWFFPFTPNSCGAIIFPVQWCYKQKVVLTCLCPLIVWVGTCAFNYGQVRKAFPKTKVPIQIIQSQEQEDSS